MLRANPQSKLLRPSPQATKPQFLPAPTEGINVSVGLAEMGPKEAIFLKNLIPAQFGVRVRTGTAEWSTDVGTGGVRTILPYVGSVPTENKLFGVASDDIYDCTAGGASPSSVLAFGTVDANSGYGQWVNFTTIAGHFMVYTDESNGYKLYTESTGLWTTIAMGVAPGEIAGVDPADFAGVCNFKSRLWFIERNTASAWYLAVGSVTGTATEFNFGNKFPHGGHLVALYSWTIDGGEGIDDYLVAVSSTGDVIIYKGNDPSSASDWLQHGTWYIGSTPVGRRVAGSFGGEIYLICAYGIVPLTKLISGALIQKEDIYISKKINPLINEQMRFTRRELGWEIKMVPRDNLLLISTPKRTGFDYLQFVQNLNTEGWATYIDVPYLTGETWVDEFYIGTEDGRILIHTGTLDEVDLNGENGVNIVWSGLQSFQDYGIPGAYHRVHFIRPVFVSNAAPSYVVEARYDYDLSEVFGAVDTGVLSGSLWDEGVWDTSLWSIELATIDDVRGGAGLGRAVAIGLNGYSGAETVLVRTDVMLDQGGFI